MPRPTPRRTGCRARRGCRTTGFPTTRRGSTGCCGSSAATCGSSCATTATTSPSWPAAAAGVPQRLAGGAGRSLAGQVPQRRLRLLRSRALRTLTQGHMAQHMFFHSLHQFAVPARARQIFGLPKERYLALRRAELSPIQIGMLYGRSPAQVQAAVIATLRERVAIRRAHPLDAGAAGAPAAEPPGQPGAALAAAVALQRPAADPPPRSAPRARWWRSRATTRRTRRSRPTARRVAYEAYEQRVPLAVSTGEIGVFSAPAGGGAGTLVSAAAAGNPRSAYNAAISANGRFVAFEIAAGQPQLREALRPDPRERARRGGRQHRGDRRPDHEARLLALGLQPVAVGRRSGACAFSAVGPSGNTVIWVRRAGTNATDVATPRPARRAARRRLRRAAVGRRPVARVHLGAARRLRIARVPARAGHRRDDAGRSRRRRDRRVANGFAPTRRCRPTGGSWRSARRRATWGERRGVRVYVRDTRAATTTP